MIDPSFYGFKNALIKSGKVLLWVAGSTATAALLNEAARMIGDFGTSHPEFIVYVGSGLAAINSFGVLIFNWWGAIDPRKAQKVIDQSVPSIIPGVDGIGG